MSRTIPLEKTIEDAIKRYLKSAGIWYIKTHGGPYQTMGLPDLVCIVGGRFVGLEVKRPVVGRLTEIQRAAIRGINKAGGYACVVTSVEEARGAVEAAARMKGAPSE